MSTRTVLCGACLTANIARGNRVVLCRQCNATIYHIEEDEEIDTVSSDDESPLPLTTPIWPQGDAKMRRKTSIVGKVQEIFVTAAWVWRNCSAKPSQNSAC
mmetsp:Transcript_94329/g.149160  ORF Transcript_94329/g.149160 Transcript_94329/m.149160 type:complete len:101 (+) Transcript_94329:49-351(+)